MPPEVASLRGHLARRGIEMTWFDKGAAARDWLIARIPEGATVMNGGSVTLEQIGVLHALEQGPFNFLRPGIKKVTDRDERISVRRRASTADYMVGGINAITSRGEIVNVDGSGNRLAAYAYGAGRVFLVTGINKIVPDIGAAMDRIRNVAAREECRHLGVDTPCATTGRCDNEQCHAPSRQCGKILIIEGEKIPGRLNVLVIGETLGY
jgi:L-lactate utilization protein LutB